MINVDRTTACRAIPKVSVVLQRRLQQYVYMSRDQRQTQYIKEKFYNLAHFPNVVACVDGTHVRISTPSEHEWEFVNRKGFHSINVQIMCDSDFKIVNCVARWPGSTHDSRMLRESLIYALFEEEGFNRPGIILGDSGYPLKEWLMVPIMNPGTAAEQRYNRAHMCT